MRRALAVAVGLLLAAAYPAAASAATVGPQNMTVTDAQWHHVVCPKTSAGVTLTADDVSFPTRTAASAR